MKLEPHRTTLTRCQPYDFSQSSGFDLEEEQEQSAVDSCRSTGTSSNDPSICIRLRGEISGLCSGRMRFRHLYKQVNGMLQVRWRLTLSLIGRWWSRKFGSWKTGSHKWLVNEGSEKWRRRRRLRGVSQMPGISAVVISRSSSSSNT